MKYITFKEFILLVALLIFGFLLWNPFDLFMSDAMHMTVGGLLVLSVALFTGFVVHEKISDERDMAHHNMAGRLGYTLGLVTISLGIAWQTIYMPYDPWLFIALLAMVFGKVFSRIYSRMYM